MTHVTRQPISGLTDMQTAVVWAIVDHGGRWMTAPEILDHIHGPGHGKQPVLVRVTLYHARRRRPDVLRHIEGRKHYGYRWIG